MNKHYNNKPKNNSYQPIYTIIDGLIELNEKINNIEDLYSLKKLANKVKKISIRNKHKVQNKKILIKNLMYKLIAKRYKEIISQSGSIRLKKIVSKKLYRQNDYEKLAKNITCLNRFIGSLPIEFFQNTDKSQQSYIAKKIFQLLGEYSANLNHRYKPKLKTTIKSLENDLNILLNQKVKVCYIGCGFFGNAFKIKLDNKAFVYKTYYPHNYIEYDKFLQMAHGAMVEPLTAMFCNIYEPKYFVKFYCSEMSSPFDAQAFILTQYLPNGYNEPKEKIFDYLRLKDDLYKNSKNSKIIDFGGVIENIPEFKDKKLRRISRIIYQNIYYKYDKQKVEITFGLKESNIEILKRFSKNPKYLKALKIIQKKIKIIPPKLINILRNIDSAYPVMIVMKSKFKKMKNIKQIEKDATKFNIPIFVKVLPNPFCKYDGYITLCFGSYKIKYTYKEDGKVTRIEYLPQ